MPVNPELLQILACPKCKGPVQEEEGGGALLCLACRLRYPVKDDIPVMLVEEAGPLEG